MYEIFQELFNVSGILQLNKGTHCTQLEKCSLAKKNINFEMTTLYKTSHPIRKILTGYSKPNVGMTLYSGRNLVRRY